MNHTQDVEEEIFSRARLHVAVSAKAGGHRLRLASAEQDKKRKGPCVQKPGVAVRQVGETILDAKQTKGLFCQAGQLLRGNLA